MNTGTNHGSLFHVFSGNIWSLSKSVLSWCQHLCLKFTNNIWKIQGSFQMWCENNFYLSIDFHAIFFRREVPVCHVTVALYTGVTWGLILTWGKNQLPAWARGAETVMYVIPIIKCVNELVCHLQCDHVGGLLSPTEFGNDVFGWIKTELRVRQLGRSSSISLSSLRTRHPPQSRAPAGWASNWHTHTHTHTHEFNHEVKKKKLIMRLVSNAW